VFQAWMLGDLEVRMPGADNGFEFMTRVDGAIAEVAANSANRWLSPTLGPSGYGRPCGRATPIRRSSPPGSRLTPHWRSLRAVPPRAGIWCPGTANLRRHRLDHSVASHSRLALARPTTMSSSPRTFRDGARQDAVESSIPCTACTAVTTTWRECPDNRSPGSRPTGRRSG